MTVQQRVRKFIVENFYVSDPSALGEEASLIEGGYVDSTGMLELITFLESEFGIKVEDREMVPENLDSIARIGAYVAGKRPPGAPRGRAAPPGRRSGTRERSSRRPARAASRPGVPGRARPP